MANEEIEFKTPGQLIQHLLDQRGWTQRVLAVVLDADETGINKIIGGKRAVDAKMALALAELFGVPAEDFLALQKTFDLAQARIVSTNDPGREKRAHLFGSLPVADMIKRGWIDVDDIRDFPKVEAAIARFFKAPSISEIEFFPHAAKKTNVFGDATPTQLAWLYRVKQIAEEMMVSRFSPAAVTAALPKLKELMVSVEAARKIPRILSECGVRYVLVECLPGAKIDGVCFWLNESAPVIGMSARYDRIDNFWFVLRHEIEHVLQGHGREAIMLDAELEGVRAGVGEGVAVEERIANQAAAEFCVSQRSLEGFIARKAPFYAERDIINFARTQGIHPGLAAGQLRHKLFEKGNEDAYRLFSQHLVKIRSAVSQGAMVDGWGDVAPVGK